MSTTLYLVNNWYECYNVYLTRERAEKAVEILKSKCPDYDAVIDENKYYDTGYYITEIKEGQGFGPEECTNGQSDVFVDNI